MILNYFQEANVYFGNKQFQGSQPVSRELMDTTLWAVVRNMRFMTHNPSNDINWNTKTIWTIIFR